MRENRTSGSARGVLGNRHSYREISEYGTFKKNHNPKSLFHLSYLYDEDPASYTGKDK